jgi:hypothetical protein
MGILRRDYWSKAHHDVIYDSLTYRVNLQVFRPLESAEVTELRRGDCLMPYRPAMRQSIVWKQSNVKAVI